MFKEDKIYIAGHTGLLGSALLRNLKAKGYTNILTRKHQQLDLTIDKDVDDFFFQEKPKYVFLAAGLTGGIFASRTYPATFLQTNIKIQNNVFSAAHKYEVDNLVFYGSSCMYPKDCFQPIKEESLFTGKMEETSIAYAMAKLSGLQAAKAYNQQYQNNRFIVLVPNSMYGSNDNFDVNTSHVLSALVKKFHQAKLENKQVVKLWGTGTPKREFVFSDDVACASIFALKNKDKLENTHYNVGSQWDYSIKELAGLIASIVDFNGDIVWDKSKPDGVARKLLDSQKFRKLGWESKVEIEDGIKEMYHWFLNNQSREKVIECV